MGLRALELLVDKVVVVVVPLFLKPANVSGDKLYALSYLAPQFLLSMRLRLMIL